MNTRHVIFDCDGVLVDSEPLSMRADVELLNQFGISISEGEAHTRFVGTTFQAMLDMMARQHNVTFPPGLHEVKNRRVEAMYRNDLKIVPGVLDVLKQLRKRGLSMSIGSNSPKARVELAVELTGIAGYFDRIVTYQDVENGKPAPDIFLKAAELAGASTSKCVVVEDSITGVTAAVAAGIRTVGFTGTHAEPDGHATSLRKSGASDVIAKMPGLLHLL